MCAGCHIVQSCSEFQRQTLEKDRYVISTVMLEPCLFILPLSFFRVLMYYIPECESQSCPMGFVRHLETWHSFWLPIMWYFPWQSSKNHHGSQDQWWNIWFIKKDWPNNIVWLTLQPEKVTWEIKRKLKKGKKGKFYEDLENNLNDIFSSKLQSR